MRLLIDIGHPAHVHYFKYVIYRLYNSGSNVVVVAREKEITFDLLNAYNISYISRGKGKSNIIGKFFYLFYGAYKIFITARKYKIDCYLSFASPYNALASFFYSRPNITLDDTEHNRFNHKIYVPLSDIIITPLTFKKDFGNKHIRFKGTMDSAYLHPEYFIRKNVQFPVDKSFFDKNVIFRFVSWHATHDIFQTGFSIDQIFLLINKLKNCSNIFISSEKELPAELKRYMLKINPEEMHHYLAKADLLIGESGSMATEAAYLGTHSIVWNSASQELGVFEWFSRYKHFYIAEDFEDVIYTATKLLSKRDLKTEAKAESLNIINDSICLTDFIVSQIKKVLG